MEKRSINTSESISLPPDIEGAEEMQLISADYKAVIVEPKVAYQD